jgi:hypothetical protein
LQSRPDAHCQTSYKHSDSPPVFYKYESNTNGRLVSEEDPKEFEERVFEWAKTIQKKIIALEGGSSPKSGTDFQSVLDEAFNNNGKLTGDRIEIMQVMIDEFKKLLFSVSMGHIVGKALYYSCPGQSLQLALL